MAGGVWYIKRREHMMKGEMESVLARYIIILLTLLPSTIHLMNVLALTRLNIRYMPIDTANETTFGTPPYPHEKTSLMSSSDI